MEAAREKSRIWSVSDLDQFGHYLIELGEEKSRISGIALTFVSLKPISGSVLRVYNFKNTNKQRKISRTEFQGLLATIVQFMEKGGFQTLNADPANNAVDNFFSIVQRKAALPWRKRLRQSIKKIVKSNEGDQTDDATTDKNISLEQLKQFLEHHSQ